MSTWFQQHAPRAPTTPPSAPGNWFASHAPALPTRPLRPGVFVDFAHPVRQVEPTGTMRDLFRPRAADEPMRARFDPTRQGFVPLQPRLEDPLTIDERPAWDADVAQAPLSELRVGVPPQPIVPTEPTRQAPRRLSGGTITMADMTPYAPDTAPALFAEGLMRGVSSIAGGTGGAMRAIAPRDSTVGRLGVKLTEIDENMQAALAPPADVLGDVFEEPHLAADPRWWATTGGQAIGSMIGFIGPAAAGSALFGGMLGFAAAGTIVESMIEGGAAFNEAKAEGLSDVEAGTRAAQVAAINVPLILGTSLIGYGPALLQAGGGRSLARRAVGILAGAGVEGA